ncbi:hypothetical protein F4809DRAFT_594540, partial [Biscogniauxia mediterranea]
QVGLFFFFLSCRFCCYCCCCVCPLFFLDLGCSKLKMVGGNIGAKKEITNWLRAEPKRNVEYIRLPWGFNSSL